MREVTADALGVNDAVGPWGPWELDEWDGETWHRAEHNHAAGVYVIASTSFPASAGGHPYINVCRYASLVDLHAPTWTDAKAKVIAHLAALTPPEVDLATDLEQLAEPAWGEP